ncbi:hypothetical protein A9Q84_20260 [Halobacteriovorax marinus]|uniref:PNPLA domain-containing protein n=1 Tax=Halobacteriovorax marinus TaxID=97084 RepID=A0A1Y5F6H2_9BACT|nr:hypothetical protein A9Q84_20260 [Halobacteriovorax marinus]
MKLVGLLTLLILISCSVSEKEKDFSVYSGVNFDNSDSKKIPLIEAGDSRSGYGPPVKEMSQFETLASKKVVAFFFYPASFSSLSYLKVVDNLRKYKIHPSVYSGAGFGAVIAALLAKGLTPDHIEWKFFSLIDKLKGKKYLSIDWKEEFHLFLKKEFQSLRIEGVKHALVLPVYDKKMGKIRYLSRGNLYNTLVLNFEMNISGNKLFYSPLVVGNLQIDKLMNKGVDKIAVINSLGSKINFYETNHYLIGLYSKLIGFSLRESIKKNENKLWINLSLKNREIDRANNIQNLFQSTINLNKEKIDELKQFIKKESKIK